MNTIYKALFILLFFALFFICTSCKTKQIITPVEVTKTEYINNVKYDSIYIHDSIKEIYKADTVFIHIIKEKYQYSKLKDTIIRVDSIPVIKEVEVIREVNKLTKFQKIIMSFGILCIVWFFIKLLIKLKFKI